MIDSPMAFVEFLLHSSLAVFCGGVLGWEREASNKPVGLRTMMLVALGAAGFTFVVFLPHDPTAGVVQSDPTRVVQGIVGGIGFLGAGSIIRSGSSVQGVTTAATIWVVGAIGVACGVGEYLVAITLTVYSWSILRLFGLLERRLHIKSGPPSDATG